MLGVKVDMRVVCGGLVDIMWRVEVDIEGGM